MPALILSQDAANRERLFSKAAGGCGASEVPTLHCIVQDIGSVVDLVQS